MNEYPELYNESYILYDRVMTPLAAQLERKPRRDRGTRRGRHSTSSSSAFDQPSSSHPNDDDDNGNDEGTSRASTSSPIRYVNSLTDQVPQIFQNPPNIDPHLEPFYTRQTEIINRQVPLRDEQCSGVRTMGFKEGELTRTYSSKDTKFYGRTYILLGITSEAKERGIFISQDKYVAEILKKFRFTEIKTASTPMETQKPLLKDKDGEEVDVHMYRSMIGSLMYLTSSRPDIMFAMCACARYQVNPKVSHLHAVKRIFSYLKVQETEVVANSTTEAEYVAASSCYG
ncbi:hypothetical protein Tco_0721970 [Tanacetum coccineum]